jgi:ABC-type dipeptide/oligopeptide/nickel transport system ATPase component
MSIPSISLDRVTKRFSGHIAVREMSLDIPAGSVFGLLGPNGAGKSTTIRMTMDILKPDDGRISLFGSEMRGRGFSRRIGYLPEEFGLYKKMWEVLVSSLTPFQMLLGKVMGVWMAGLLQMAIWGGMYLLTSQRTRIASLFNVSPDALQSFPIPAVGPGLLVVFLLYFALGFLLYGVLYAAIGAI